MAGAISVGGTFAPTTIAVAQPAPEVPGDPTVPVPLPSPTPPAATVDAPLAQTGSPAAGLGGIPALPGIDGADPLQLFGLLGQAPRPEASGGEAGPPLEPYPLNNRYLLLQNEVPSAPGQGSVGGVAPGQENADIGGGDYLQRLYATYQQGGLTGALLGQRSQEQLGEPLPGTAPPPGTPMPPGLGQNLPDPLQIPGGAGR